MNSKYERIKSYALVQSLRSYIGFISNFHKINGGYKSTKGIEHFGFIPACIESILKILVDLCLHMKHNCYQYKFLDIGCGIGNVVLLAQHIGFDAYGLEYNKKICNIARKIVGKYHIFSGDMTEFKKYGEYDILYYYLPMNSRTAMAKFDEKLIKEVKPGAYVIPYGGYSSTIHLFTESKEFEEVKLQKAETTVFRKKIGKKNKSRT